jgi:predicted nucleotidyltransferase
VVFTPQERDRLRQSLIEEARQDSRITAAALVGSAATDTEDRWSDIDLALRLAPGHLPCGVAPSWTELLTDTYGAIAHTDVWSGSALYRVFLLPSSLQVDVSFWPDQEFRAAGGPISLAFGDANDPAPPGPGRRDELLGMAWLHALHVRSSIARRRGLQAVSMLNGMREQVVSLACLRLGLPAYQGRGVDRLPDALKRDLEATLPRSTASAELARRFDLLAVLLAAEVSHLDGAAARDLVPVLRELVRTSTQRTD